MKKINLTLPRLALVALVALSLAACTGANRPAREFTSAGGGFSIRAPMALEETVQLIETEAGPIELHMYLAESGPEAWVVGYSDYPQEIVAATDPATMLDGAVEGAAANVQGELVSVAPLSYAEHPGRDLTIRAPAANGQVSIIRGHMFLVGNRLYQVMAVVPPGQENSRKVTDFLQSFQLTRQ